MQSESESKVAQSCPTLCNPMDYSLLGSSVHGIFQARVLEWVAIFLLQGIFLNLDLLHCSQTLYLLSHLGSPYAEYIMWNAKLDEAQVGIKIAGRNINNLRYATDNTLMAESEEELKSLLMKVNEETEKAGLKVNIQKTKIMASGPITSWQIDGETMETVRDFIFLGSKITANGDCSHEIKRCLLLGRKAMTKLLLLLLSCFSRVWLCVTPEMAAHPALPSLGLSRQDSILKSRDITLPTKVRQVKAMVFH